ncbi:hypothetical protein [Synechocystis sp. PCC 7509]|uniref:hypothetical protein n=1 Tax=Synechocystis sp. PCC 7509 TaxID=927677 RepID=UPI0002AC6E60|nr:hypothetical protein [Synechocystis sp. PCC 7509]
MKWHLFTRISAQSLNAILHRLQGMLAIWRSWKTPLDAIAWAVNQLPDVPRDVLEAEFEELEATNGKKAPAWVARVEELKVDVF